MSNMINVSGPFDAENVEFISLQGSEKFSEPFVFKIKFIYNAAALSASDVIGQNFTLSINFASGQRCFSGVIRQYSYHGNSTPNYIELTIVPLFSFLQQQKNSRIFQQLSVTDIISQVLGEHSISYSLNKLSGTYSALDYCVQYRETDFAFVSRLLARYGLFYYFTFENQQHTMMICDNNQIYTAYSSPLSVTAPNAAYDQLIEWQLEYNFTAGSYTYNDHDFTNPTKTLITNTQTVSAVANNTQYEIYDHPGGYTVSNNGQQLTKIRMEQLEAAGTIAKGKSTYTDLLIANSITLDAQQFPNNNSQTYAITELKHDIQFDSKNKPLSHHLIYQNEFQCVLSTAVFHSNYPITKPLAPSMQLATIAGTSGSEMYTDQYGRLKVQFVWDRSGAANENSSCWMRAMQQWDGVLRIGTPVIVGFLDDDIDQPIILGPVYNANLMPVNTLPDNQTQSVLKRRNVQSSVETAYNQILFEDKQNSQQLAITATKDMLVTVTNNLQENVNQGTYVLQVQGDITISTQGACNITSQQDMTLQSAQNINITAGANLNLKADMGVTTQAGTTLNESATEINQSATAQLKTSAPMQTIQADGILALKGGLITEN